MVPLYTCSAKFQNFSQNFIQKIKRKKAKNLQHFHDKYSEFLPVLPDTLLSESDAIKICDIYWFTINSSIK